MFFTLGPMGNPLGDPWGPWGTPGGAMGALGAPGLLARGCQKTKLNFCVFLTLRLSNFARCASQARNTHSTQLGQNLHQMGRHKRSRRISSGKIRRSSPQIFLEGSQPLNLNFLLRFFDLNI